MLTTLFFFLEHVPFPFNNKPTSSNRRLSKLNSYQEKCVETEGHLLITACPGSGKTTVLSFRAEFLLNKYSEGNLMAVTFTKDAADELRSRIVKKNPLVKNRVGAGTFHSLAMQQLKRTGMLIDLLSERESDGLIKNILTEISDAPDVKTIKSFFTKIQAEVDPAQHPSLSKHPQIKYVWDRYTKIKADTRKMDFSDLIFQAVKGMKSGTVEPYKAKWILADEAQDMDAIQHEWIQCHAQNGSEVTIVGDDDQAIFSFRSSKGYAGMESFKLSLGANSHVLPINYRCGTSILSSAAELIEKNNPQRIDKPIQAGVSSTGVVHEPAHFLPIDEKGHHPCINEFTEVVEKIQKHAAKQNLLPPDQRGCDWAVLARDNMTLDQIQRLLMEQQIPYERKSGSFWDAPAVQDYLSVLNYIIKAEWFGFSMFLSHLLNTDNLFSPRVSNLHSLLNCEKEPVVQKKIHKLIKHERDWQNLLYQNSKHTDDALLKAVADFTIDNLSSKNAKTREGQEDMIKSACSILSRAKGRDLKNRIFLQTSPTLNSRKENLREKAKASNSLFISLMTMHSSKGLEFDNVFIINCQSSIYCDIKSDGSMPLIPEERRLFYVAITRAKKNLMTSYTSEQMGDAIFLNEAGLLEPPKISSFGS
jgi:superfamily I DNA/RNA helicase